jgi:predicted RNA-binding protein with RPS1 domain
MKILKFLYASISRKCDECKMQLVSNEFNTLKVNDSIDVQILKVQEVGKKSLTHSNINVRH